MSSVENFTQGCKHLVQQVNGLITREATGQSIVLFTDVRTSTYWGRQIHF